MPLARSDGDRSGCRRDRAAPGGVTGGRSTAASDTTHVTSGLFACPVTSYTSQSGCAAEPGFATGFGQRVRYLDGQMAGATQETDP